MKRVLTFGAYFYVMLAAWAQPSNTLGTAAEPMITFDTRTYAFGKVVQGDLIRHDFVVSNAGNQTLHITDVHPSCGCTTAGTWPHELEPGKSGVIPIQINTKNLSSAIKKTVTVTSNDRHSPTILQLSGEVVKSIDVTPAFAMFHLIMGTTNIDPAVIKISNRTEQPLTIKSVTSDSAAFRVTEVKTLEEGKEYQISVAANPPFARGTNGTITVSTGWSNYMVRVPAYLTVQPAIIAQPHAINVPAKVDHEMAIKITLYSMRPEDQFSDPKSTDDRITVSLTNSTIGKPVYTLTAVVPADYRTTPGHPASISVKTTDAQMPLMTIPVMQAVPYASMQPQPVVRTRQSLPAISASAASPGPAAH